MSDMKRRGFGARQLVGALLLATVACASAGSARAAVELIPSLGITKSTDGSAGDAQTSGGIAVRFPLVPFLKAEGGIGYRQESFGSEETKLRQWPITTSLWLTPIPMLYAGGGVGWYRTTIDYPSSVPYKDSTTLETGVHLGGGLNVPIAPHLGLDFNGRYIFMQKDNNNIQVPTTFNPNFWTTSIGLAISL